MRVRTTHVATLTLCFATALLAGCGNRGTALSVMGQANSVINAAKEEAAIIAPAELKAAEATLEHMKQSFDQRDYQVVVDDVPKFNAQMDALKQAVAAKRTVTAAASEEWNAVSEDVSKSVEAIQARVDSLTPDAEGIETAKADLETLKTLWAEASAIATAGDPIEATNKGRIALAKATELMHQLGMNETLASAG